jgi:predicted phage terminase large subunit-like protein
MLRDDAEEALRVVRADRARRSFGTFVRQAWPYLEPNGRPFVENPGTSAIIDHLQAVGDGRIRRLLMAISPGFGKSTLATVGFPLWMWARDPSWRVICASYAHLLASQLAGRAKRVLESEWYRDSFGVRLVGERTDALETTAAGRRYAVGVMGALTGFRADCAIVDDSLNAVDAYSEVAVKSVNEWFDTALSNRLDRGDVAPMVVIQQCLAEADLIGHLRARGGWEELVLPAEFEPERRCRTSIWVDPRTAPGQLLAPEVHSAAFLDEQKRVLGPYGFAAQYQQRPAPLEGGVLKRAWWRWYRGEHASRPRGSDDRAAVELPEMRETIVACDLGFKGGKDHDNTAMAVVGAHGADRYVLELVARPMEFLDQIAELRALRARWPKARRVLIEDSANCASLMSMLKGEMQGLVPVPTGSDSKASRIMAHAPALHGGNVWLREGAGWAADLVEEAAVFPNGRRDDRLDALALALAYFDAGGVERARVLAGLGGKLVSVMR